MGFPSGASGKEPACQCRRHKRYGFDPWLWKIPWRRAQQPTLVFWPGEFHGQRSWGNGAGLQSTGLQRVGHDWSELAQHTGNVLWGPATCSSLVIRAIYSTHAHYVGCEAPSVMMGSTTVGMLLHRTGLRPSLLPVSAWVQWLLACWQVVMDPSMAGIVTQGVPQVDVGLRWIELGLIVACWGTNMGQLKTLFDHLSDESHESILCR